MASNAPAWHLISLRPQGQHESLRRAAAHRGGGLIALSSCRLAFRDDALTRQSLDAALASGRIICTSPAAVRAAAALRSLGDVEGARWFAVGAGTAAALRRAGVSDVRRPQRMDSEGLLALPELQQLGNAATAIGLVTAPGGRGLLQPALRARGARVVRADVYAREPLPPPVRAVARLRAVRTPLTVAISSHEALTHVLDRLPDDAAAILRRARAVTASARLAAQARELGFDDIVTAPGPRPSQLVAAVHP